MTAALATTATDRRRNDLIANDLSWMGFSSCWHQVCTMPSSIRIFRARIQTRKKVLSHRVHCARHDRLAGCDPNPEMIALAAVERETSFKVPSG
jgi:hypothetical protein